MVGTGRTLSLVASLLLSAFATASAQSGPWSELARKDLEAIRQTVMDHHPGPVDPLNPAYRAWVERGYEDALEMADSVVDLDGLMAVTTWYVSGFDDGHLGWARSSSGARSRGRASSYPDLSDTRSRGRAIRRVTVATDRLV